MNFSRRKLLAIILLGLAISTVTLVVAQDRRGGSTEPIDLNTIEADAVGVLDDDTPFVEIPFSVRRTGSRIRIDHAAVSGNLDPLLYLVDSNGSIVAENDDRERGNLNSLIEFPQAAAGQYRIIATRYGITRGRSSGQFRLLIDIEQEPLLLANVEYRTQPGALLDVGFPQLEPSPQADWTVLAYYGGDTNLELSILNDFNEFELAGGSDDSVRIVALVDRHPDFTNVDGNWTTTRLYEVGANVEPSDASATSNLINSSLIADLGDLNTSDGETFAQFLVWGIRNYPAENYVITMASHGAGWQGLITDDTAAASPDNVGKAILTTPEIEKALEIARAEAGIERFALLINDACSMSSIEYFSRVSPYFTYSLASPEIVVDPALNMTDFINLLRDNADRPNFNLIGEALVDRYITRDVRLRESSDALYMTNALTSLSRFEDVTVAVENFATVVNDNIDSVVQDLGNARSNTYTYTHFMGEDTLVDLGDLMQWVRRSTNNQDLIDAARQVEFALDHARLYGQAGERVQDTTSYYNIYFPNDSSDFDIDYFEETPLPEWSRMLRNFYNRLTPNPWLGGGREIPFHVPNTPSIRITRTHPTDTTLSIVNPAVLGVEIAGRNLSYADVTIDQLQPDGSYVRLSTERLLTDALIDGELERLNDWEPGITQRDINWDVALPFVSDGETGNFELLVFTEEIAFLDGRYQEPDGETWYDVSIGFDLETNTVQRVVNRSVENNSLAVIDIPPGATFQAYRSVVTPDGDVIQQPGTRYVWGEDGLVWSWEPAPTGEYQMGLLMTSFGGTRSHEAHLLFVDNSGYNADVRAETRPNQGFTIVRPDDWDRLAFSDTQFLFRTQNEDNTANKTVYWPLPEDPANLESIAEATILENGLTRTSEFREGFIDNTPGLIFDYSYDTPTGTIVGRGIAVYHNDFFSYVFAAEGVADVTEIDPVWDDLLATTTLFDDRPWFENNQDMWERQDPDERLFFAPFTWDANETPIGPWLRFSPVPYAPPNVASVTSDESGDARASRTDDAPQADDAQVAQAEAVDPATLRFFATGRFAALNRAAGAENSLAALITGYATADADQLLITGTNTYFGEYHRWQATLYNAVRYGVNVTGRVYVTEANNRTYAIWAETPIDGTEADVFTEIVEPVVDGFIIREAEFDAVAQATASN